MEGGEIPAACGGAERREFPVGARPGSIHSIESMRLEKSSEIIESNLDAAGGKDPRMGEPGTAEAAGPIRASGQTHPPSSARGGERAQRCPAAPPAARHLPAGPHGARPAHRHLHPLALPSPCPSPLCPRAPARPWKPNPAAGPPQAPRAVPARPPRPLAPLLRPRRSARSAPPLRRTPPPIGCEGCHSSASPTLPRGAAPPADAMAGQGGRVTRAG